MKVKIGQRRFLLRNGYTDEQIDKMTSGTARSIISALEEKNLKAKSAEDTDRLVQETHNGESCETCTAFAHAREYGCREAFARIYEEIHENFRKDSVLTGKELLEFIQRINFQMLKEAESDDTVLG